MTRVHITRLGIGGALPQGDHDNALKCQAEEHAARSSPRWGGKQLTIEVARGLFRQCFDREGELERWLSARNRGWYG